MLTQINRKDCLNKYKTLPLRWHDEEKEEVEHYSPKTFDGFILTLPAKSFKGRANHLGLELSKLVQELGSDSLIFMGDNELPWLTQKNDYNPAKNAILYLSKKKIGKQFHGALQVCIQELPIFVKHLAWLIRCNAALPYFHFIDPGENILGAICQYGNVHLNTLKEDIVADVKISIERSKLEYLNGNCYNEFSKNGGIKGRQIILRRNKY